MDQPVACVLRLVLARSSRWIALARGRRGPTACCNHTCTGSVAPSTPLASPSRTKTMPSSPSLSRTSSLSTSAFKGPCRPLSLLSSSGLAPHFSFGFVTTAVHLIVSSTPLPLPPSIVTSCCFRVQGRLPGFVGSFFGPRSSTFWLSCTFWSSFGAGSSALSALITGTVTEAEPSTPLALLPVKAKSWPWSLLASTIMSLFRAPTLMRGRMSR
mmetsp:Transcript_65829/g.148557  ORF Transcript_65829/g.148557 Transcript_65829/m.148557 type:complete len:213 (-) Transcript_65829:150-788(-)